MIQKLVSLKLTTLLTYPIMIKFLIFVVAVLLLWLVLSSYLMISGIKVIFLIGFCLAIGVFAARVWR
jgi:uncharacterized oligopeptide transporter (OPT) family protein